MKGSPVSELVRASKLILSAGHGGRDCGACFGPHNERDQCITIVNEMASILSEYIPGSVVVTPHKLDTHEAIPWMNRQFAFGQAWAVEVHRDSADTIQEPDASLRCGVYHSGRGVSNTIAGRMRMEMLRMGAHSTSWSRDMHESRHGSLMWITGPRVISHLMELGFMEGDNSPEHLKRLARIGAAAVLHPFAGILMPV